MYVNNVWYYMEIPLTLTLALTLSPPEAYREISGKGGAKCVMSKVYVARAQIDALEPILDQNTSWTSWVYGSPLLTYPESYFFLEISSI